MEQRWYIWIRGEREGPYTAKELRADPRVQADTLCWYPGMERPLPVRAIPTLVWILAFKPPSTSSVPGDLLTLSQPPAPRWMVLWIILFICLFLVLLIRLGYGPH